MKSVLLLSLVLMATRSLAADPGSAASPEPYSGQYGTMCPTPDTSGGAFVARFGMPIGRASSEQVNVIERYLKAIASGRDGHGVINTARIPSDTQRSCAAAVSKLASTKECSADPLDVLKDGEIRQLWNCNGILSYVVLYTVDRKKLTNIWAFNMPPPVIMMRNSS